MGQYWQIVNLTTMRSLGCMGKLGESLWGSQEDLVKRIARGPNDLPPPPIAASLVIAKESFSSQATTVSLFSSASGNLSAFNRLPAELVRMIFEEFATFVDAFVFGLTCSSVWICGKPVIHRLYFRWFAPWSGQRLICVGDYASDLPDSLHEEGVLDELSQVLSAHRTRVREIHGGNAGSEGDDKDEEDDLTKWTKSKEAFLKSNDPKLKQAQEERIECIARAIYEEAWSDGESPFFSSKQLRDVNAIAGVRRWTESLESSRFGRRDGLWEWFPEYEPSTGDDSEEEDLVNEIVERKLAAVLKRITEEDGGEDGREESEDDEDSEDEDSDETPEKKIAEQMMTIIRSDTDEKEEVSKNENDAAGLPDLPDETIILRNLSKRVYVRSDTLSVTGKDHYCGLGRALLSRICWSTDDSAAMSEEYKGEIHRGVWAGDCFDIIKLRELDSSVCDWEDVTREVRKEMLEIWEENDQKEFWRGV